LGGEYIFPPFFHDCFFTMNFSKKQTEWQHAFYEWHLHRTEQTADELKARKQLLSIIQQNRRKKQQWTVGEVA